MSTETKKGYYKNGQLKYERSYQNEKKHGINKGWYENGQLKYEWLYQNGKEHGINKVWYENGQLKYEHYCLYGEQVSIKEYRKHELITQLSGLNNEYGN